MILFAGWKAGPHPAPCGSTTLRPDVVQSLLEACTSVKVKRLFLWASGECDHSWLRRVNTSQIELGSGKRALYKGGKQSDKPDPKQLPTDADEENAWEALQRMKDILES